MPSTKAAARFVPTWLDILMLDIESSCDDTATAMVRGDGEYLAKLCLLNEQKAKDVVIYRYKYAASRFSVKFTPQLVKELKKHYGRILRARGASTPTHSVSSLYVWTP